MTSRWFTGLDIGTSKVCAVVAEVATGDMDAIQIVGTGVCPFDAIRGGTITDRTAAVQAIEQAIHDAGTQAGHEVESVAVGISGPHIASHVSAGRVSLGQNPREIVARDVDRAIEASRVIVLPPDRQIVHSIPRVFLVDDRPDIRQPVGMRATNLEVKSQIVHGGAAAIKSVEACVTAAGIAVTASVLEPLAAGESVLTDTEKESGVCLLDIGGNATNVAVFVCGVILHSAVIPVGGNHVTSDIVYGLTVDRETAERLKLENGCAIVDIVPDDDIVSVIQVGRDAVRKLRRRALVQIIEPRMQELLQLVMEELGQAECLDRMSSGFVLTGGGSLLNGTMEMVNRETRCPVRMAGLSENIRFDESLYRSVYTTAIGLAHYAIRQEAAAAQITAVVQETPRSVWSSLVKQFKRSLPR